MALRLETSGFPIFENLRARGPHPSYRDKLKLFGQFVGVWDLDVLFYDQDRKVVYRQPGEWSFAYVLDGRAIQDVLVYPNQGDGLQNSPCRRRIGTTLRFYDPRADIWQMIWLGFRSHSCTDRKKRLMTRSGLKGWIQTRTSHARCSQRSRRIGFTGKTFSRMNGGGTWRMEQEMFARRRLT